MIMPAAFEVDNLGVGTPWYWEPGVKNPAPKIKKGICGTLSLFQNAFQKI